MPANTHTQRILDLASQRREPHPHINKTGLYWNYSVRSGNTREDIMGKTHESSKEAKKQALKNPKEKRAAKRAKKHGAGNAPLIGRQ
ncbi:hypothetical protein [Propionivibrio sp.]|uniref:hypothetical protein n=1 Tax=Propionivibrio sp. TaxID=2212460 RepID=UPI00272EADB2|nr:hypothetical protein [Propionivibrio sp.]